MPPKYPTAFNPKAHPALPEVQKRAAHAIFRDLELPWIPSEYWEILVRTPNPIYAFREFLRMFGISATLIRAMDSDELALLEQCIGMLLEIRELKDWFPARDRLTVLHR